MDLWLLREKCKNKNIQTQMISPWEKPGGGRTTGKKRKI